MMRSKRPGTSRHLLLGAAVVAATLAVAACGSDSNSTSSSASTAAVGSASTAASTAASAPAASGGAGAASSSPASSGADCKSSATAFLKDWETPPTELPKSITPLSKPPSPGGSYIYLALAQAPSDADLVTEFKVTMGDIGWNFDSINYDGTIEDLNSKFTEAIGRKPTVIGLSGIPLAAIQQPLAAARDAGIIVNDGSVLDPLESGKAGFVATSNGPMTYDVIAPLAANWLMKDSGCKAHVAIVAPDYPILQDAAKNVRDVMSASCPDCKANIISMQPSDMGTPAGLNQIVSAIQADSSIKYVYVPLGNVVAGLAPALRSAGIEGIKITGALPTPTSIKDLQAGDNAMWVLQTSEQAAWSLTDSVLRTLDSGTPTEQIQPVSLLTTENVPKGDTKVPTYPTDYRQQWLAKWGVKG